MEINYDKNPTVFDKLLEPVLSFVQKQDQGLKKHPGQVLLFTDFFRMLIYYFVTSNEHSSIKKNICRALGASCPQWSVGQSPSTYSSINNLKYPDLVLPVYGSVYSWRSQRLWLRRQSHQSQPPGQSPLSRLFPSVLLPRLGHRYRR